MFQNALFQAKIDNQKCCRLVRFSGSKYTKGFAPDSTGELSALPQSPSWFLGELRGIGGEGRKGEGKGGNEECEWRGWERSATSFFFTI